MAIANRELDVSEQTVVENCDLKLLTVGSSGAAIPVSYPAYIVPRPMTLSGVHVAALGLSGAPTLDFAITRNAAGGATVISGGMTTLTLQVCGTSGPQAGVLAAAGSSFLSLAKGDLVQFAITGDDVAAFVTVSLVVKSLQDIKSHF